MADGRQKSKGSEQKGNAEAPPSQNLHNQITIAVNAVVKSELAELKQEFKDLEAKLVRSIQDAFAVEAEKLRAASARREWVALVGTAIGMVMVCTYVLDLKIAPITSRLEKIEGRVDKLDIAKQTAELRKGPPKEAGARPAYTAEMKGFIESSLQRHIPPPVEAIKGFATSVKSESFDAKDSVWDLLPVVARYATFSVPDPQGWKLMPEVPEATENIREAYKKFGMPEIKFYERDNPLIPGKSLYRLPALFGRLPLTVSTGSSETKIVNGIIPLDGAMYQNITFEKTKILYEGGPFQLINVTFINCEFIFPNRTPRTLQTWASIVEQIPNRVSSEVKAEVKPAKKSPTV